MEVPVTAPHFSVLGTEPFLLTGTECLPIVAIREAGRRFHVAAQNLKGVEKQILERTGLVSMAPGTLNVTLPFDYIVHADTTIEPDEYFTGERLKLQRCRVCGHRMIIMRPDSHELPGGLGADVLELISPLHLRTDWGLQDLDELEVEVEGDQSWWERPDPTDLLSHRDALPR